MSDITLIHCRMIPRILDVCDYQLHGSVEYDGEGRKWIMMGSPEAKGMYKKVKIGKINGTEAVALSWGNNYAEMRRSENGDDGYESRLFPGCEWDGVIHKHATLNDMVDHACNAEWQ